MTKYAAFGTHLEIGTAQIETATIVCPTGAITGSGNIDAKTKKTSMTGSEITTVVAVLDEDTEDEVAKKIYDALSGISNITDAINITLSGSNIAMEAKVATADDGDFNLSIEASAAGGCTGLTDDTTSTNTEVGIAQVEVAAVKNIGGPGLALDVEDVTTHDSTNYWEEVVATVIRSGEVTLEIVYDPADNTHDATDTNGLVYRLKNRDRTYLDLMFMGGALNWTFFGVITGFEPGSPVGGALTATVKVKITGQPTLE